MRSDSSLTEGDYTELTLDDTTGTVVVLVESFSGMSRRVTLVAPVGVIEKYASLYLFSTDKSYSPSALGVDVMGNMVIRFSVMVRDEDFRTVVKEFTDAGFEA